MALTRNLYREDEVLAALRYSLVRGKAADALFWVQEGIDSDMDVRIFQTLLSVWLQCVGVQNIPWLGWLVVALRDSPAEEDIMALTVELARSVKDSSVFALLVNGMIQSPDAPDRVRHFALPSGLTNLTEFETTFARAILQGKNELAWSLSIPLWANGRADEILYEIQPLAVFNQIQDVLEPIWSEDFVWPFRALAILMASSKQKFIGTSLPPVSKEHVEAWTARKELPMRARRQLGIPPECLYWHTQRGNATKATERNIMGNLRHMLKSSPFWVDKLDDDEAWDTYFTSDIPDEWSAADRQKSHWRGPIYGLANPDHGILFERALSRLFSAPSKLIWQGRERAIHILVERWTHERPASFEEGIGSAYNNMESHVEKWDLTPVRVEVVGMSA